MKWRNTSNWAYPSPDRTSYVQLGVIMPVSVKLSTSYYGDVNQCASIITVDLNLRLSFQAEALVEKSYVLALERAADDLNE